MQSTQSAPTEQPTPRYGMTIPFDGLPLHAQRDLVVRLADLGYTDVWSSETNGVDGFTPLALASQWAPELRLGTAIIPTFTRAPGTLAQCALGMAEAAPGRFVLGLGTSSDVIVEKWNGVPFTDPYGRTRDTVRFVRRALAGEKVSETFPSFAVSGFRLTATPAEPVPIVIAALREGMLRLAGREGDGALLNWLAASDVPRVAGIVDDAAGGAPREIVARIFVCPIPDPDHARAIARHAIAAYLNVPVYRAFHEWLGRGDRLGPMWDAWAAGDRKAALAAIPDEVCDELVVHGSPEACRDHVLRYVEGGVTCPVLALFPLGQPIDELVTALAPA